MVEVECPKEALKHILLWFEPGFRMIIASEPSSRQEITPDITATDLAWKVIESRLRESGVNENEFYRAVLSERTFLRAIERAAKSYGQNIQEVRRNLRTHVEAHEECHINYVTALSKYAYIWSRQGTKKSVSSTFLELDRRYLRLFGKKYFGLFSL